MSKNMILQKPEKKDSPSKNNDGSIMLDGLSEKEAAANKMTNAVIAKLKAARLRQLLHFE
jgi:hypothetical protein